MLRIKILTKRNHPFAHKVKVNGVSLEVVLLTFFILIVLFLAAVSIKHSHKTNKKGAVHGVISA